MIVFVAPSIDIFAGVLRPRCGGHRPVLERHAGAGADAGEDAVSRSAIMSCAQAALVSRPVPQIISQRSHEFILSSTSLPPNEMQAATFARWYFGASSGGSNVSAKAVDGVWGSQKSCYGNAWTYHEQQQQKLLGSPNGAIASGSRAKSSDVK